MSERVPAIKVLLLPKDTNNLGTIFGGVILSHIDLASAVEARKAAPHRYVTKAMHEVEFHSPVFVGDIVNYCRQQDILVQGRGSAANSCVCFLLGVTSIDPIKHELLFERFVSGERKEPPDIDVDFEHERREEIIQWIYETYGRHRSALTAVVTRSWRRSL